MSLSLSRINASAATLTKNRTEGSITPSSGMCVTCVDGCIGMCEIGKSAYRGHEVIYPQPFGVITTAAEKTYPVDYSHFNIMGTAVGAHGIEADSDKAIFPAVNLEVTFGHDKGIKFHLPFMIPGIGSTNIAKNNWEGLAIGTALAGTGLTIGENVVGMDPEATFKNGRVVDTVDLKRRVKLFKDHQRDGYGATIVQANVEDTRLGVQEYAIEKLGVEHVELKWGQGAKDIGGEVKVTNLKKAQLLYERGYVVLPNPTDPTVIKAFERGAFKEFERHSRIGMVSEESFAKRVEELRRAGAKYIFLKTGAYRPADLARAVLFATKYKLDLLTVDGAGGGTGMSPLRPTARSAPRRVRWPASRAFDTTIPRTPSAWGCDRRDNEHRSDVRSRRQSAGKSTDWSKTHGLWDLSADVSEEASADSPTAWAWDRDAACPQAPRPPCSRRPGTNGLPSPSRHPTPWPPRPATVPPGPSQRPDASGAPIPLRFHAVSYTKKSVVSGQLLYLDRSQ